MSKEKGSPVGIKKEEKDLISEVARDVNKKKKSAKKKK